MTRAVAQTSVAGWRWQLTAGLICTAVAVYGSFVPFTYQARPWNDAVAMFVGQIGSWQSEPESRADFAANILLFVPIGFFFMGALRVDRRGVIGSAAAAAIVALTCIVMSLAIEFAQVFFPPRTASISDVVAQTIGTSFGLAAWAVAGAGLTDWVRRFSACRNRGGLAVHLLGLYVVLFAVSEMLPLDITISLGNLADKYQQGRVMLVPFSNGYASPMLGLREYVVHVLLYMPIGALALIGWTRSGTWRRGSEAFVLGCVFVAVVEAAQLFVFSRFSDVTDLFVGSAGVAFGIALTRILAARPEPRNARSDPRTSPWRGWA